MSASRLHAAMSAVPSLVPGEYAHVAATSADVDALRLAHATPISRVDAVAMIQALAAKHLPPGQAAAIIIRWGSRWGRAGRKALRTRTPRVYRDGTPILSRRTGRPRYHLTALGPTVPYISLPRHPMSPGGPWAAHVTTAEGRSRVVSLLRVGLVLHEFAHVIHHQDNHGPTFTARLDCLVADWRRGHV